MEMREMQGNHQSYEKIASIDVLRPEDELTKVCELVIKVDSKWKATSLLQPEKIELNLPIDFGILELGGT